MPLLSPEQYQTVPEHCPNCEALEIETGNINLPVFDPDEDTNVILVRKTCLACHAGWYAKFKLVGYIILKTT